MKKDLIKKPERQEETISIRLPKTLLKALDTKAKAMKVSRGFLIRELVREGLGA